MPDLKRIDLHVHSTGSDGTYTPTQLVALAQESGLGAFALTDHDSISGVREAVYAACGTNVEIVPGLELSCEYQGKEIHMLGFYLDPEDETL
ncbi:MAG: PHP domain-containing protein, partial [Lachnospiraceae bacterium]|nr:PHP domain-containing protein [Lachnospiraceae bacterium]